MPGFLFFSNMIYEVSAPQPNNRFLHIKTQVCFKQGEPKILQLPVWRPGRYEKGDFAQYVRNFRVSDSKGNSVTFRKTGLSVWEIGGDESEITVHYEFWAGLLNAGSTFVSENMVYINPVNCFLYSPGNENQPCELILRVPDTFQTVCTLKPKAKHHFTAESFHELADSPLISSDRLTKTETEISGIPFRFWFCTAEKQDWSKILTDVEPIIRVQLDTMREFPAEGYDVLTHLLPYPAYHGVEHLKSTVITLGPAGDFFKEELYPEFLGVFSHELFHVWNVKSIRPADMLPYDYSKENLSQLGYVYEGITTYYGDLFCLRAGVFSWDFFAGLSGEWLTRHHHNFGRKVFSVAESSLETWLDGYKPGIPDRRVNIYNEGALCAIMADWYIRIKSGHRYSLDDVMRSFNEEFGLNRKGYTRNDYRRHLEKWAGDSMEFLFTDFLEGRKDYLAFLAELAHVFGLELSYQENPSVAASVFGFKTRNEQGKIWVDKLVPGGPAEKAGLCVNDEILSVNGTDTHPEWEQKLTDREPVRIKVNSMGEPFSRTLYPDGEKYLPLVSLSKKTDPSEEQKKAFALWTGCAF